MSFNNYDEIDLTLAIQLQEQFQEELRVEQKKEEKKIQSLKVTGYKWNPKWKDLPEPEQEKLSVSLVDSCWELLDPNPDMLDLFLTFNHQFFWGRLLGVEVKWSPRMTLCAGVCSYEGRGGLCSIRLSTPLLKLRPRKDLVETLLHEMIHAYLFVTHNNTDHDGHGPQFHKHMNRINKLSGTKISVYHTFHDEVNTYRQHIWRCDGPCQARPPYFGLVKRSMNRAPAPSDFWWEQHSQTCGGTYSKIKEPEGYKAKNNKRKAEENIEKPARDIRTFFPVSGSKKVHTLNDTSTGKENGESHHEKTNRNTKSKGNSTGSKKRQSDGNLKNGTKKTMSGTATKASSSTGSKTVVLNKTKDKKSTAKEPERSAGKGQDAFSGTGYTLGVSNDTSRPGTSRLLAQFEVKEKERKPPSKNTSYVAKDLLEDDDSSGTDSKPMKCPRCRALLRSGLKKHLATCAEQKFASIENLPCANHNPNPQTNSNSNEVDQNCTWSNDGLSSTLRKSRLEDDIITLDDSFNSNSGAETSITKEHKVTVEKEQIYFPCPICNKSFHEDEINWHTNSHFT